MLHHRCRPGLERSVRQSFQRRFRIDKKVYNSRLLHCVPAGHDALNPRQWQSAASAHKRNTQPFPLVVVSLQGTSFTIKHYFPLFSAHRLVRERASAPLQITWFVPSDSGSGGEAGTPTSPLGADRVRLGQTHQRLFQVRTPNGETSRVRCEKHSSPIPLGC